MSELDKAAEDLLVKPLRAMSKELTVQEGPFRSVGILSIGKVFHLLEAVQSIAKASLRSKDPVVTQRGLEKIGSTANELQGVLFEGTVSLLASKGAKADLAELEGHEHLDRNNLAAVDEAAELLTKVLSAMNDRIDELFSTVKGSAELREQVSTFARRSEGVNPFPDHETKVKP